MAGKIFCPGEKEEHVAQPGDIHSNPTVCLLRKPLFKLSWRSKIHFLPVRQVVQGFLDTQVQLVYSPCAIGSLPADTVPGAL